MRSKIKHSIVLAIAAGVITSCSDIPKVNSKAPEDSTALRYLIQSPGHTVLSQQSVVRFGEVQEKPDFETSGYIIPDERRTNSISARVNGRIDKLYVRSQYEYVLKGQKLMEIYSPELTAAIDEHIFLFMKEPGSSLVNESRIRLERLGVTSSQIHEAEKTLSVPATVTIYSPYDGYNLPINNTQSDNSTGSESSPMGMPGMLTPKAEEASSSSGLISEGSYFRTGQTLFSLNDAAVVIALLSVSPMTTEEGSVVLITPEVQHDSVYRSTISIIEPEFRNSQKFLLARAELKNSGGHLKFNSPVNARISSVQGNIRTLPTSCVYNLGMRNIVWVRTGLADGVPVFTPQIVVTGRVSGKHTEIISGLQEGDEIALQAGLLTDRDGIIQTELK